MLALVYERTGGDRCNGLLQDLIEAALTGGRFFTIALGCFVEPVFSPPSTEFNSALRHPWVQPIPDAVQLRDPMGADAEAAWQAADPRGGKWSEDEGT